jgi:hypothetical protein
MLYQGPGQQGKGLATLAANAMLHCNKFLLQCLKIIPFWKVPNLWAYQLASM